jgi:CRP-like cAMP-binding protein
MSTKVTVDQLRAFSELASLGDHALAVMAPVLELVRYRSGAQICREGDEGDGCFFLLQGDSIVSKNLPDGRRVRLATLPAGTLFGQSGLIPGQLRTADVKAEGEVVIATLTRRTLGWALGQGIEWAVAVQAIVAIALVRQLRSALDRLGELAASEDASAAAEGRTRASIAQPKGFDVDFSRRKTASRMPAVPEGAEDDYEPLPPIPEGGEDEQTGQLLSLLAETETSLAGQGVDLGDIEFVFDEDQKRVAEARGR